MFRFSLLAIAVTGLGCVLPEVSDEELGDLPPPCAPGWEETSDGQRCVRAAEMDGGMDAGQPGDGGTGLDAGRDSGGRVDAGGNGLDGGADGGADAGSDAGHMGPPDSGVPRCFQPVEPGDGGVTNDAGVLAQPVINEFNTRHAAYGEVGRDFYEYFELYGSPDTDYSHLTLVVVDSHSSDTGSLVAALAMGRTNRRGFWRSCEGFQDERDLFPQGSFSLFLVRDFAGTVGVDLDADDDGALDMTPWGEVVDQVAGSDTSPAGDLFYATPVLTADGYPGHEISGGRSLASRIPDGVDTDSEEDWHKNDYGGAGLPASTEIPRAGEGYNTPGEPNRVR